MDAAATGTGPVVLVVDDSEDVRSLLAILLLRAGYQVLDAIDGQAALELASGRRVDLVVLDLSMPRLDGAAFCRAYRGRGGTAPVVLITATQGDELEAAMRACGAVGHIPKPFEIEQALAVIEHYARRAIR
jgi:CheY-like chemotaxis protein